MVKHSSFSENQHNKKQQADQHQSGKVSFVAPGADNLDAVKHEAVGKLSKAKAKKHGFKACLCRMSKILLCFVFILGATVSGLLYYFLFTLSGAQKALDIAQRFIPSSIMIDTTIESGSIFEGLHLGKTLVDVQDVITVGADNLVLEYDLWQLKDMKFKVNVLESSDLHITLNDKLFEPSEKVEEPSEPFELVFPVDIDLDRLAVNNFTLSSQIVDVGVGVLEISAKARAENLSIESLDTEQITVHLKNEAMQAQENAEIQAADAVDSQLAISVGGQVKQVENLASAVNEVVTAAQQGKSVEFIIANAQAEADKAKVELNKAAAAQSTTQLNQDSSNAEGKATLTAEQLASSKQQNDVQNDVQSSVQDGVQSSTQNNVLSREQDKVVATEHNQSSHQGSQQTKPLTPVNVELTTEDTVPVLLQQYSDPEVFAEAIELALLNEQQVPAFSNGGVVITDPRRVKLPTNATLQSSDTIHSAVPTKNPLLFAQASNQLSADGQKVNGQLDSTDNTSSQGEMDDESAVQMAERGRSASGALPGVNESTSPVVKDFSDGNGAIQPLASVKLPFNIEIKHFTGRKIRYVMDGFDTQEFDLDLVGTWQDTLVKLNSLELHHGMGQVSLDGSVNLDRYFDLDLNLSGEGYKNDINRELFEGALYGLNGTFKVQGDLTNLQVNSNLNLGGSSVLNVHLNALSAALPMEVSLKVDQFAYPIFDEPLVDLKMINFYAIGNLVDGLDVALQSEVSGFDFKDVAADFKAQISFEKSHIDHLQVNGQYLGEPLEARASGDLFYGSVVGADMQVYAKVKDAGFIHEMLSGPLFVDADLIAIMNRKALGKSAVSVASQPAYLENRIPVVQVSSEDFDPEALEATLLASVSGDQTKQSFNNQALSRVRPLVKPKMLAGGVADTEEDLSIAVLAQSNSGQSSSVQSSTESVDANNDGLPDVVSVDEVAQAASGAGVGDKLPQSTIMTMASNNAAQKVQTKNMGQEQIITQAQYVSALEQSNANLVKDDKMMSTLFNQDLPEVKTDIRHIKAELYVNHQKTTVDIQNVVGDLQKGFRVQLLKVLLGTNTLQAQGQLMERKADLQAVMNFNDFSAFVPGLSGEFKGQMIASGTMRDLNFTLSGHVPKLNYQDMRVRKLVFDAAFNLQTQSFNFTALADRVRLTKSMKANRQFFLDFSGTPLRHNVTLTCDGSTALYLSLDGSLDTYANSYNANLLELYVSTEEAGTLSLINPVFMDIDLNTTSGEVAPVELKGEIGLIKLSKTKFAPGFVETALSVRDFNLKSLKDLYPDGIFLYAPMDLDANVLVKNSQPDIKVHISSQKGLFASSSASVGVAYDAFDINATFTQKAMRSEWTMTLRRGAGQLNSLIVVKDPLGRGELSGDFKITDFDLTTISNVGQTFSELNGMAQLDMKFGGTIYKPLVYGDFTAKGNAVPRYDVGQINNFDFKLSAQGQKGQLDGVITLNEKDLTLNGTLDWSDGPKGALQAHAQELPVFLIGYGVVRANLDAAVNLSDILDIKAKVLIPSGRISVNDVASSGVVVSGDEVLVSPEGTRVLIKQTSAAPPMKSKMDVDVRFGKDVQVSALGMVKGHLVGGINIVQTLEDQNIRANGEIQMVEGTAEVFSRKFTVDEARINFKNNLTNPSLYVSVIADKDYVEDDVEVGVRVTGTATSPDIKLFSKPSMSENEILSYILYGHGLEKSSIAQDSNNSNMLLGLGISSASGLVNSLAGAFGVQGLQVGSQGSGDETQVQVQGYISRRLRLSYGYGVFNALGEFKVRYELVHQLYVEYVSSIEQAIDLIYSFSFD